VTAALTIVAAVGGFALAKEEGRLEIVLVLPLVLTGLGLLVVEGSLATQRLGSYIREDLMDRLPRDPGAKFPSWEHFAEAYRREAGGALSKPHVLISAFSALLIFGAPSIAALVLTRREWNSDLAPLWWTGLLSLVAFAALAHSLRRPSPRPSGSGRH
jgi:hypothetical protein